MNVLVAGGSGYIGSRLCEELAAAGHRVLLVDRRPPPWPRLPSGVEALTADLTQADSRLTEWVSAADALADLAGLAVAGECAQRPDQAMRDNVLARWGLLSAVWAARQAGMRVPSVYVYASSISSLYRPEMGKVTDESSLVRPSHMYGVSKLAGELLIARMAGGELPAIVFRQGNVYGPSAVRFTAAVIPRWIKDGLGTGRLWLKGDGRQVRSFVFIDDLIAAWRTAIERGAFLPGGVYNLGGEEADLQTVAEYVAASLKTLVHCTVAIERRPAETADEATWLHVSSDRAKNVLGYAPATSLKHGIDRTVMWLQQGEPGEGGAANDLGHGR